MNPATQAFGKKLLLGLGGLTLASALGVGLYHAIFDRPPKFARIVAEDLPADSVGLFAFADPAHALGLFDEVVSAQIRGEIDAKLGFDPLRREDWAELGLDLDAPIGAALVELDGQVFAFSLGLSDADKARATLDDASAKLGLPAWEPREFAGRDCLWQDSPPAAVLFRDDRLVLIASEHRRYVDFVVEAAEEIAGLTYADSLAASEAFASIGRFEGEPIMLGWANLTELGRDPFASATFGRSEAESAAMALTADGSELHLITQTTMVEGSKYLAYMRGRERPVRTLDQVPGPVFAGLHWSVDPQYFLDLFDELGVLGKQGVDEVEREVERELGVGLRDDLFAAWAGEFGILWTGAGDDAWGGLVFASVRDETEAERLLERIWSRTDGEDKRQTDAGTVYAWGEREPLAAKIHAGQLWVGLGDSRIEGVGGDDPGFRKTSESRAVAKLVDDSATAVAFVDFDALRELLGELPRLERELAPYANVLDELEALTMRSRVEGRTFVWTMTLHTRLDDAYDSLLRRFVGDLIAEAGDELLEELGVRRRGCVSAVEHMLELTRAEASDPDAKLDGMREALLGQCEAGKFDPYCVLGAWSSEAANRCVDQK